MIGKPLLQEFDLKKAKQNIKFLKFTAKMMPFATIVDIRKSSISQCFQSITKKYFLKLCKHCEIELFLISSIVANGTILAVGMGLL